MDWFTHPQTARTIWVVVAVIFAYLLLKALWTIQDYLHQIWNTLMSCQQELEYMNEERRQRGRDERFVAHFERTFLQDKPEPPEPPR